MPSQHRYAAPTIRRTSYAACEVVRSADTPTAAATPHASTPAKTPNAVANPARRPPAMVERSTIAVSIPGGLITPIVRDANGRSLSSIALAMKDLGARAKEGKLQPDEYQGGTASISNMGMMGIKQFTAVINPPQAMIMAVGAGEKRPYVMDDGSLGVATVMCCTGSFDHRAIDGADGAQLMAAFKTLVEKPLGLVA